MKVNFQINILRTNIWEATNEGDGYYPSYTGVHLDGEPFCITQELFDFFVRENKIVFKDEIEKYFLFEFIRVCIVGKSPELELETDYDFNQECIISVTLENGKEYNEEFIKFQALSDVDKILYLLKTDYKREYPLAKEVKSIRLVDLQFGDILPSSKKHYEAIEVFKYFEIPQIFGVVRKKGENYIIVDGNHRLKSSIERISAYSTGFYIELVI